MVRIPLVLAFAAAICVEVGVPALASLWAVARLKVPWIIFGYGVLTFGIAGLLVLTPLTAWAVRGAGAPWLAARTGMLGPLVAAALATAVIEQAGRYLGFRLLFGDLRRTWRRAVVFGLGYGSLQSVYLVGLPAAIALVNAIVLPQISPAGLSLTPREAMDLRAAQQQIATMPAWMPLADGAQSTVTLLLQVGLSVLVVQAFLRSSRVWLVYAAAIHVGGQLAVLAGDAYARPVLGLLALTAIAVGTGYWALRLRPEPMPSTAS